MLRIQTGEAFPCVALWMPRRHSNISPQVQWLYGKPHCHPWEEGRSEERHTPTVLATFLEHRDALPKRWFYRSLVCLVVYPATCFGLTVPSPPVQFSSSTFSVLNLSLMPFPLFPSCMNPLRCPALRILSDSSGQRTVFWAGEIDSDPVSKDEQSECSRRYAINVGESIEVVLMILDYFLDHQKRD